MRSASAGCPRRWRRWTNTVRRADGCPLHAGQVWHGRKFGPRGPLLPAVARNSRENTPFVKHLHLLRHAKSSWEDPDLVDHERPLAPRGESVPSDRRARSPRGIALELVLCSTALRARRTLAALLPVVEGDAVIRLEDGLYGAGVEDLLSRLRGGGGRGVGSRGRAQPDAPRGRRPHSPGDVLEHFPTGALARALRSGPRGRKWTRASPTSGALWFRENSAISFVLSSSTKTRASPVRARRFPYPFLSW